MIIRHRWPLALALGISHLALLIPVLGLFEHPHYHSDRYSLIPSICWSILVAAVLANANVGRSFRIIALPLVTTAVIALGLLSYQQTLIWQNSVTLFKRMIEMLGDNPYRRHIHQRLGVFLAKQEETEEAIEHLQEVTGINPQNPMAYFDLGFVFQSQGKLDETIQEYKKTLGLNPNFALKIDPYFSMGRKNLESALR